jgi:hypothetical protein
VHLNIHMSHNTGPITSKTKAAVKSYPAVCTSKENYASGNITKETHQFLVVTELC